MRYTLKYGASFLLVLFLFFSKDIVASEKAGDVIDNATLSSQTQACIGCHNTYTPGIVQDWFSSRHSKVVPSEALKCSSEKDFC